MVNFQPSGQMRKMFIQPVTEAHRKKKTRGLAINAYKHISIFKSKLYAGRLSH